MLQGLEQEEQFSLATQSVVQESSFSSMLGASKKCRIQGFHLHPFRICLLTRSYTTGQTHQFLGRHWTSFGRWKISSLYTHCHCRRDTEGLRAGHSTLWEFNLRFKRCTEKHSTKDLNLALCDLGYVTNLLWNSVPSGQNKRLNNIRWSLRSFWL